MLQALASREELVRTGKLTTIVFIRDKNGKNQEVSGYIDLAHRMRTEDFTPVFECKKRLLPKPSDLSYFNWETNVSTSNSTPHYQVIADSAQGLLFKNKRDRKIVNVNPESAPGDNRSVLYSLFTHNLLTYPIDHSSNVSHPIILVTSLSISINFPSTRIEIETSEYIQVVLYDHSTRRRL